MPSENLSALSDAILLQQTEALTREEHATTLQILDHLNEIEWRRLHLDLGYSSMFDYCVRRLKYSPSAAGRRIQAARCIRRHPAVLPLLRDRELNLSVISLIEPILTPDNVAAMLKRMGGVAYREAERIVSEYRPPVAFRERVRPVQVVVPSRPGPPVVAIKPDQAVLTPDAGSKSGATAPRLVEDAPGAKERNLIPSTPPRTERQLFVQFLASEELMQKVTDARSILSHRCRTMAEAFDVMVTEFLDRHSPAVRASKREARTGAKTPDSRRRECNRTRHIPARVRDEVFAHDQGRCAFVSDDGTRCTSRKTLQIDHIKPFASGGGNEPANLRLLCAAHNLRAAELTLGAHVMLPYWKRE